jgi:hypothetical protein
MKKQANAQPGLSSYRTGGERILTKAKEGSKTQRRKAELRTYDVSERKNGRVK